MNPTERILTALKEHARGNGWSAKCPAHDDQRASLTIGEGEDGRALVKCHAGCANEAIVTALGMTMADLMPTKGMHGARSAIAATHDYRDEAGDLLFQVVRFEPKGFRQRKPNAAGGWDWSVKGTRRVPYRLPELLADPAATVYVVEGEKDADNLACRGLVATCNSGGAAKWTAELSKYLAGRQVIILPDADEAGRKHSQQVAALLSGVASSSKVVELPGLPAKGDVSDWLAAGGTREELERLADEAAEWTAKLDLATADSAERPAIEPAQPFPVDALPGPVGAFVREAAEAVGCDPSFVGVPLLACLARAVGNTRTIELKKDWQEPAIVWGAIVGLSGTHKSPAVKQAMKILRQYEATAFAEYAEAQARFKQERAIYERDYRAWERSKTGLEPPPEEPQEPNCRRYLCQDITVEALAMILAGQSDGVLVARDELAGWLNGMDQYKGGKGGDTAHWLSCWQADPLTMDRKTGQHRTVHILRAAVSIIGGIQPDTLRRALGREHFQDGLCARLLLTIPDPRIVQWTEATVGPGTERALAGVFDKLLSMEGGLDDIGNPSPLAITFTPEAKAVWVAYYDRHHAEMEGMDKDLRAAWAKLTAYTARFALIVQLCSWAMGDASAEAIDQRAIESGIALSEWFGTEARRAYAVLAGDGKDDEAAKTRRLVDLIRQQGSGMTARELTHACRQYRGAGAAEAALNALADAGLGRWVVDTSSGGRPARVLVLHEAGHGNGTPLVAEEDGLPLPLPPVSQPTQHLA